MDDEVLTKSFRVEVEYCASSEYEKNFSAVNWHVLQKYKSAIVKGRPTLGDTQCFEVKVYPDAQSEENVVVHSKLKGDELIDENNIQDLLEKIDDVLIAKQE